MAQGAGDVPAAPEPAPRHVLALIDSRDQKWELDIEDPVHSLFEMALDHLGMVVRRHDIRKGPPPKEYTRDLRAVITCFQFGGDPEPWLWPWLEEMGRRKGLRFVHLRDFGPLMHVAGGKADTGRLTQWLRRFGLGYDDFFANFPNSVNVEYRDEKLCAYELDPRRYATHQGPWSQSAANTPWVTTSTVGQPERRRHPVVTGPWGGVALEPWVVTPGDAEGSRRWHLDLFEFFREALGLEGVPAPDPVVLNGRRLYFCHIDGDGFESLSTIHHGQLCGKVFLTDILSTFELPFTASVIVASLTTDLEVAEPTVPMQIASEIFRHPLVEPASHTVLHPFAWHGTEDGEMDPGNAGFRALRNYEPRYVAEVTESVKFINERLCPPGKHCDVMLWSGTAVPGEAPILECARLGVWNLNAGIYRWDPMYDSVGYVPPLGRLVGDAVQVYCGAPNEDIYDGFYDTVPTVFRHVDKVIENTGRDRILKPANVYIHFYSVERPGRIRSLKFLLRKWGIDEPTAPVFASYYANAVHSTLTSARVERIAGGWRFRDFGSLRTARIDGEKRHVDWARSPGLLGAKQMKDALYLHLAGPEADVVLSKEAKPLPHVLEADHRLVDAKRDASGVSATSVRLARGEIVFAGFPPRAGLAVTIDGQTGEAEADADGRYRVTFEHHGKNRVEVRLR